MDRRKFGIILLIALMIIFNIILIINKQLDAREFKKLLINVNSQARSTSNINLNKYMYNYNPYDLGISQSDLSYVTTALDSNKFTVGNNKKEINKIEAISDVNFLFKLLKYSYAGYSFFGGDSKFENTKENIIKTINSYKSEKIKTSQLEYILDTNLDFIQDGHFNINNKSLLNSYSYYSNEDLCFIKNDKGYYIIKEGTKFYIESINDACKLENYLKLSINAKGDLCYHLGILLNCEDNTELKLTLKSKDKTITEYVSLKKSIPDIKYDENKSYNYSEKNNIPIVAMRRMYDIDSADKSVEMFEKSAIRLKNQPFIIIDIRGNSGGQDIAPITWFENYTGEAPQINSSSIELCSLVNNYVTSLATKNIDYEKLSSKLKEEYNKSIQRSKINSNRWYTSQTKQRIHINKAIIFVLIDNKVASSGESFINYLKTLQNVILVGTNTSGVFISNHFTQCQLPHSCINIKFGNTLTFYPLFQEGKGFQPDIWLNSNDSLDRVIKLISRIST